MFPRVPHILVWSERKLAVFNTTVPRRDKSPGDITLSGISRAFLYIKNIKEC